MRAGCEVDEIIRFHRGVYQYNPGDLAIHGGITRSEPADTDLTGQIRKDTGLMNRISSYNLTEGWPNGECRLTSCIRNTNIDLVNSIPEEISMTTDRRAFLIAGSSAAVAAFLPNVAIAVNETEASEFEKLFEETNATARTALQRLGYKELAPHPIVTGDHSTNGGLRPNPDPSMLEPTSFTIQPVSRVGDIAERDRADLLPLFHTMTIRIGEGETQDEQIARAHDLLVGTFGLDPDRIAFATVPDAEYTRDSFSRVGWDFDEKVLIRDPDQAKAMNDGSGYFVVVADEPLYILTIGIYYRLTDSGEPGFSIYPPPPEWTEIGEFVLTGMTPPTFGFGAERLTLAVSSRYPAWEHRLDHLTRMVDKQVDNGVIPPALEQFRALKN